MMTYNDSEVDAFGEPFDYDRFIYDEDGNRYPLTSWYVVRDQAARTADDTVRVVIGDVSDLCDALAKEVGADADTINAAATAKRLYDEANALFDFDDPNAMGCYWANDEDGSERLQWLLESAEQLPNVAVDWNGDAGTVTITRADRWQMGEDA